MTDETETGKLTRELWATDLESVAIGYLADYTLCSIGKGLVTYDERKAKGEFHASQLVVKLLRHDAHIRSGLRSFGVMGGVLQKDWKA